MKAIRYYLAALLALFKLSPQPLGFAVNAATNLIPGENVVSLLPTAAHAANVLVKWGADAQHYAVCGANDFPIGFVESNVLAGETGRAQAVCLLGSYRRPLAMTCSETIAYTDELYTAAAGAVQNLPVVTGTYYKVGRPLAAGVSGAGVPAQHCYPVAVAVS